MALTYGFYDSINGDRTYSSSQFSTLFNGIINDGIFQNIGSALTVSAPTDGRYVIVGTGRAWFDGTWVNIDSAYPLPRNDTDQLIDIQPDLNYPRIDAVYIEVNHSSDVRATSLKYYSDGDALPNPQKPVFTDTDTVKYYVLAYITVPANATKIEASYIENMVGRASEGGIPFITGILQTLDATNLIEQWRGQFTDWTEENTETFGAWWDSIKAILSGESIVSYASRSNFPVTGDPDVLYLAEDVQKIYRWVNNQYVEISDATDPAEVVGNMASTIIDLSARVVSLESEVTAMKHAENIVLDPGSSGWSTNIPHVQFYQISWMRDTDTPIIERAIPDSITSDTIDEYEEQCNLVTKFETVNGGINAYCYSEEMPTMQLVFTMKGR